MRHYLVAGRTLYEDDDCVLHFQADDADHAAEQFRDAMASGYPGEEVEVLVVEIWDCGTGPRPERVFLGVTP
jgi:hypothetical protein